MLKVLSLFSGIGAFEKALTNLEIPHEVVGFSEIDESAVKAYSLIHDVPLEKSLGDIRQVDIATLPSFDLLTYGFPCQDISTAGQTKGFSQGSDTRSSLLWEAMRIVKEKRPTVLIAENVPALLSKRYAEDFNQWIATLETYGYQTYHQVLNAKDYGLPQDRKRVFVVSILKEKETTPFTFPAPIPLTLFGEDLLEETVDQRYYNTPKPHLIYFPTWNGEYPITTNQAKVLTVGHYLRKTQLADAWKNKLPSQGYRVRHPKGIMPTILADGGGIGRYGGLILLDNEPKDMPFSIRRVTELECWRLMGFDDTDYYLAKTVSDKTTFLYRAAGNSIAVSVAEAILQQLNELGVFQ